MARTHARILATITSVVLGAASLACAQSSSETSTEAGGNAGRIAGEALVEVPRLDPDESVSSPPMDAVPDQAPGLSPTYVEPVGDTTAATATAIDRFVSDPSSTTVEAWFWSGVAPCSVLDSVSVDEGSEQVVVTVFVGTPLDVGPDVACIAIAQLFATSFDLGGPLGTRILVDGSAR